MLVMRNVRNTELESRELAAAMSFQLGAATSYHYHLLLDLTNLLLLAGSSDKKRQYAVDVANKKFIPVLTNIKERFDRTGKLGVSAQETDVLFDIVEFSKRFWNFVPMELYATCVHELKAFYAELGRNKVAA